MPSRAVLDRVQQNFAERRGHSFLLGGRQIHPQLADELHDAAGGFQLAPQPQSQPVRAGGEDLDIVLRVGTAERPLHHFRHGFTVNGLLKKQKARSRIARTMLSGVLAAVIMTTRVSGRTS